MKNASFLPPAGGRPARPGSQRYARYVFWVLFVIGFLNYLDRNILTGAADVVAHELGLGIESIGYIASAFLIVYTLCILPMGYWADCGQRKNVVAVSVAVWSVATAFTALSFHFLTLFLSRMVLGFGEAGYFPAGTALLSDYFSREKRSRVMSWWSAGQLAGIFFGLVIGGLVAGLYVGSWRLAFLFTGIPGLGLALLSWRLREPQRNQADEEEAVALAGATGLGRQEPGRTSVGLSGVSGQIRDLLGIKTIVVLVVMQIFAFFVLSVAAIFLPTFLQQKDLYGMSSGAAGLFSGVVILVAGSLGTVCGGYLADLLNRYHAGARVLVCGLGFLLGAPAFALSLTVHNVALFTLFLSLTTLCITIYTGPATAATQDVVPATLRASAVALTLFLAHLLGDTFSPTMVGVLAHLFDPTGGVHFAQNLAGHDLALALLVTCTPALALAGLVGIVGARWMQGDLAAALRADRLEGAPGPVVPAHEKLVEQ